MVLPGQEPRRHAPGVLLILLVEDDPRLAGLVCDYLRGAGLQVRHVGDGDEAVRVILDDPPELVLLDVELPGRDGLAVCRAVRERYAGPIVMLTARADEIDEIVGLEVGADAYLAKPVSPRRLLAHVRAQLRRPSAALQQGPLSVDPSRREALLHGEVLSLGDAEFDLLVRLVERAGEVVRREDLLRELRGLDYDGLDRSIDQRISRLRKALGADWIKTVRGEGYLLRPPR